MIALLGLVGCGDSEPAESPDASPDAPPVWAEPPFPIGEPFGMDEPVISTHPANQHGPVVAANGDGFLVVWEESRDPNAGTDLWGVRVGADGSLLGTGPFPLIQSDGFQRAPAIAWNGSGYLLVWRDCSDNSTCSAVGVVRLAAGGTVLDADPLWFPTESPALDNVGTPAVASNGDGYLVAWSEDDGVRARRIAADGNVLDAEGILVTDDRAHVSVTSNGADYLVVSMPSWIRPAPVSGARITASGELLDPAGIAIAVAAGIDAPSVASDGTGYFVVWSQGDLSDSDVYGARVSAAGVVVDGDGIPVRTSPTHMLQKPKVTWNGSDFVVAWHDRAPSTTCAPHCGSDVELHAARVSSAGVVLDTDPAIVTVASRDYEEPAIAAGLTGSFVVWTALGGSLDVYGARIADGIVIDPDGIVLSTGPNGQSRAQVASNGSDHLVVWTDERRPGQFQIYGVRVSASGEVLDAEAFPIAPVTSEHASVASNGDGYLVVWDDERDGRPDVYGARVSAEGVVLDPGGFRIAGGAGWEVAPAVASNGVGYYVVWTHDPDGEDPHVYGSAVSADGVVAVPDGVLLGIADTQGAAIASNGAGYLVAWSSCPCPEGWFHHIGGRRVGADGAILDAESLYLGEYNEDTYDATVASDGAGYLVQWRGRFEGPSARLVPAEGTVTAEPIEIARGAAYGLAWGGGAFLVVSLYESVLTGALVSPTGSVLAPEFQLSGDDVGNQDPAVSYAGERFLLVYTRDYRIEGRILGP